MGTIVEFTRMLSLLRESLAIKLNASEDKRRHAKIGNNCMLGAGCMLIGKIEIGDNVIIAAKAIVTKDVPPNSVVKNINEVRPIRPDELQIFNHTPHSRGHE